MTERFAWKARILPGSHEEHVSRHDHVWPELVEVLKEAVIKNYSIWNAGDELFGYFECSKGVEFAENTQARSPVVAKWNEYMLDVMVMEIDEATGAQPKMRRVFLLE
ncbi:MAG: L-rhamnose mutarotase [Deltaproteobacteria bacterium]|jgi:L-rhamnose mutarotase|nr:L-rhamnose mutarotase [Deltaproteobacteria bacterium]